MLEHNNGKIAREDILSPRDILVEFSQKLVHQESLYVGCTLEFYCGVKVKTFCSLFVETVLHIIRIMWQSFDTNFKYDDLIVFVLIFLCKTIVDVGFLFYD